MKKNLTAFCIAMTVAYQKKLFLASDSYALVGIVIGGAGGRCYLDSGHSFIPINRGTELLSMDQLPLPELL